MITPVILCGGSGTRLWPLSRESYPKQFVPLLGEKTLFQNSAQRMSGAGFQRPVVVTNSDFRFIVTEQLHQVGIDPDAILIEPDSRNTAPAVLAAALHVAARDPSSVMLVAPADHVIPDAEAFETAVKKGLAAVSAGELVTFGIQPTYPETAYGYLEKGDASEGETIKLKRFVEKPNSELAAQMVADGGFLWNSGIFLFRAQDIIDAFKAHCPSMVPPLIQAVNDGISDLGFFRLNKTAWDKADDISLDYAVMEKATNLSVVPLEAGWSDLGAWDAVWRESHPNNVGMVIGGSASAIECTNSLLRSESEDLHIVGIGLDNIIAIAMKDAVLVADMSRAQDIKRAVSVLKARNLPQATTFPKDHRPWGWFESLVFGDRFQVKRIHVNPGASLSLQSHHHRAEHWIVVSGTAEVTINDRIELITENQSVYIPLGAVHRMKNPGKIPMVLIEVQTGRYLGEDDIIRYDDVYARGQGAKG